MESVENKIINKYLNGNNAKYFLPQHKNEIENWIRDNIQDDFYQGEFVDVAMESMQKLFSCKSDTAILSVYNNLIYTLDKLGWGVATYNEVINMVSKYAKNGERLYKLHYKHFNEKQLNFYDKIKEEHKGFNENSMQQ